jgi:hypothetical protein
VGQQCRAVKSDDLKKYLSTTLLQRELDMIPESIG